MILRELHGEDADAVRRIYGPRAAAALHRQEMTTAEALAYVAAAHTTAATDPRTEYRLGIDVDQDMLGLITVKLNAAEGHLSYIIREDAWGHGHCTEAVRLLTTSLAWGVLTAKHPHDNLASGRVLTKNGFAVVGQDKRFCHHRLRHC